MKSNFLTYNLSEVPNMLTALQQPAFRTKQLLKWVYLDGVFSYDEMTNLPKQLRHTLAEQYPLSKPLVVDKQTSTDGTRKYVFQLDKTTQVEAVGIPSLAQKATKQEPKHLTVCFSTQAGCSMNCAFCATGQEGLQRNLSSGEMLSQILLVQHDFGCRVSNVVSMGQGEPFRNYKAVLETLHYLNAQEGFAIGARHITVSTCGIIPGIQKLAQEPEQFTLAVSLHSAEQAVRNKLMPYCKAWPLSELKDALLAYVQQTGRRPSLEYLLIHNLTDTPQALVALQDFCRGLLCHVNLIPMNEVAHSSFKPSSPNIQQQWTCALKKVGIECTVRNSRGADIDGACGQLKNKIATSST